MLERPAFADGIPALIRPNEVHRRVYADPDIFRLEIERVFGRSWILMGHECQIPKPGDYFLGRVGIKPVIVVRDRANKVRVFLNFCTHRGSTLCAERTGHVPRFICPYHAWTFGLDGKLIGIPLKEEYRSDFNWGAHGLAPIGEVELYRGFIFVNQDPRGLELATFLGDAKLAFDNMVDRSPDQELIALDASVRYRVRANWKMVVENLNDSLHSMFAHASATTALRGVEDKEKLLPIARAMALSPPELMQTVDSISTAFAHSYGIGLIGQADKHQARYREIANDDYFAALAQSRGEEKAREILENDVHLTVLYPSAAVSARMQSVRLIRPLSVNETEIVFYVYGLKGAPDHILQSAREYTMLIGSPSSYVIVDDLEIYERCQSMYDRGDEEWISVHRGFGTDRSGSGGLLATGTSEGYIRNQYAVWSRFMGEH